jgi:hypothetical protein
MVKILQLLTSIVIFICTIGSNLHAQNLQTFAFPKISLGIGYSKSNPTSFSLDEYESGHGSASVNYLYFMEDQWLLSVSGGFKTLVTTAEKEKTFFLVNFNSQKLIRIYHPLWLGIGFNTLYLVGVERQNIPYTRDKEQIAQVGAGVLASLIYSIDKNLTLVTSVQRWRGTANNRLHLVDFNVGVSWTVLQ